MGPWWEASSDRSRGCWSHRDWFRLRKYSNTELNCKEYSIHHGIWVIYGQEIKPWPQWSQLEFCHWFQWARTAGACSSPSHESHPTEQNSLQHTREGDSLPQRGYSITPNVGSQPKVNSPRRTQARRQWGSIRPLSHVDSTHGPGIGLCPQNLTW